MTLGDTFAQLLIALGLGLLVGLQKERAESPLAGVRTFALVTTAGAVAALLALPLGPWVVVAGLVCVTALLVTGNFVILESGRTDGGQTTEIAVVLMLDTVAPERAARLVIAAVLDTLSAGHL